MKLLNLHAAQVQQFVDAVDSDDTPRVRVQASAEARAAGLRAFKAHGIEPKERTIRQLDAAMADKPWRSPRERMEFKSTVSAAGFLLEEPNPSVKRNVVVAALTAKAAKIPLPQGKPYSMAEFDDLAAAADLSVEHKLELKGAFLAAGLVIPEPGRPAFTQEKPVQAAAAIVSALGLPEGKLNVPQVDKAIKDLGWNRDRAVHAKTTLTAAGLL